jgi:hypothetical protein
MGMMPRRDPGVLGRGDPNARLREGAERGRLWEDVVRSKSMTEQAPMKMITGPNIMPGRMMDPNQMNVFQRQAFLPSGSAFERGGASMMGGTAATSPHTIGAAPEGTFHTATGEPTYQEGSAGRASAIGGLPPEQQAALLAYMQRYQQGG